MKTIYHFTKGFKHTGMTARMVVLLLVINLAFALILAVPMYQSLKGSFGNSLVGDRMAEGFDALWWEEFNDQSEGMEKTFTPFIIGKGAILNNLEGLVQMKFFELPPAVLIFGLLYIILHTFLAGGILTTFKPDSPHFSMKSFFNGAGEWFGRFLGIMLISWVFLIVAVGLLHQWFGSLVANMARGSISEVGPFWLALVLDAVVLFLLFFFQMIFDYARIDMVLTENRSVVKSILRGFGMVFKHPGSTLGFYYLIFIVNIAVTLVYILIRGWIPDTAAWGVLIAFGVQQLFIFAVVWIRCWLYAGQIDVYRFWN